MRHAQFAALLTLVAALPWAAGGCSDAGANAAAVDVPDTTAGADATADAAPDPGPAPPPWCAGATMARYDPVAGAAIESFPDDWYTRDDAASPTGVVLALDETNATWVAGIADLLRPAIEDLNGLSGFGSNGGVLLRFSGPVVGVPEEVDASLTSDAVMLLDLSVTPPARVPYRALLLEGGADVILEPLRPMRLRARHAAVVTTALKAADGGCVAPSATLRQLLTGAATEPRLARLHARYADLLARTALAPEDISAATVFTVHDDLGPILAAADDVVARDFAWDAPATCSAETDRRRCEGSFEAWDYRGDRVVADGTRQRARTLPVTVWLPTAGAPPYPTVIFGHGINSSRGEGSSAAWRLTPLGFAVVAVDAVEHGDHPDTDPAATLSALAFLGIDLDNLAIDARRLRGNFNQSNLDRLQLIELIRDAPDVDGDGVADLDGDRIVYHGISLGGMMGASLLALTDDVGAAALQVAGGKLLSFATDNAQVEPFKPLLYDLIGSEEEFVRLLTAAQALVDAADPATFGAHVLTDRLRGDPEAVPDVLVHVSIQDEIVPPAAGKALARAMQLPHVGAVIDPVATLPSAPPAPVSGNLRGGATTAGFYQLDRVTEGAGVTLATHDNTPWSPEGELQLLHFLTRWRDAGLAEINDPYVELATPPLP